MLLFALQSINMNVTSTLKGVRGQVWLCVTTFVTETEGRKARFLCAKCPDSTGCGHWDIHSSWFLKVSWNEGSFQRRFIYHLTNCIWPVKKIYRILKLAVTDAHIKDNECRHWIGKGYCKTQGVWAAVCYICLLLIHVILQDVHFLWWEERDIYRRSAGYALLEKLPHA